MIKMLVDANLSWRLCKKLEGKFLCLHVNNTGLSQPATDSEIWEFAVKKQFDCVLTNDEDFEQMSRLKGAPPKVLLLKTGNQTTESCANLLIRMFSEIERFIHDLEYTVLELTD